MAAESRWSSLRPVRWRRLSLRVRLTVAATALVALALVAAATLVAVALERSLVAAVEESARSRALEVALLVETGRLPDPIPVEAGTPLVQIVDGRDRVLAASAGSDRLVPILLPDEVAAVHAGGTRRVDGSRLGQADPLLVVGEPVDTTGAGEQTVLVAMSLAQVEGSLRVVRLAMVTGAPALVVAFALACWLLVGSALRPVDALRRGAAEISSTDQARRLPVPFARDEMHRLAVTLNDMLDRLERSSARQRSFVADAAHELRSPLAAIRTELEVARAHPSHVDWGVTSADALADVARLSRLVDDLLLLTRLDEHVPGRHPETTDVALLADAVVVRAGPRVRRVGAPSVPLVGDADALTRVIANLVDNAVRYARTMVTVDVGTVDGAATICVEDDGPGIAATDRERVFERFTRLDAARNRDAGGSGLGLAIVRELVRAHGGTVRLDDCSPGSDPPGLRVVVTLPIPAPVGPRVDERSFARHGRGREG